MIRSWDGRPRAWSRGGLEPKRALGADVNTLYCIQQYFQAEAGPQNTDCTHAHGPQEMVASIVVLPLIFDGVTFGGFYVTLETTSNFQNIKDLLMGLVNSVVLLLAKRLQPQRDQIWESILSVGRRPCGRAGWRSWGWGWGWGWCPRVVERVWRGRPAGRPKRFSLASYCAPLVAPLCACQKTSGSTSFDLRSRYAWISSPCGVLTARRARQPGRARGLVRGARLHGPRRGGGAGRLAVLQQRGGGQAGGGQAVVHGGHAQGARRRKRRRAPGVSAPPQQIGLGEPGRGTSLGQRGCAGAGGGREGARGGGRCGKWPAFSRRNVARILSQTTNLEPCRSRAGLH